MATLFLRLRIIQRFEFAFLLLAMLVIAFAAAVADARELARRMHSRNHLYQHSGDHGDWVELDAQLHVVKVGSCPLCSSRHPIPYCSIKRGPNDWEPALWWMLPESTRQEALRQFGVYKGSLPSRRAFDTFHASRSPKPQ
jgi:hypothetical protein